MNNHSSFQEQHVFSLLFDVLNVWQLGTHGSNLTEEELETHTISAWKEAKLYLNSQVNGLGSTVSRQLVQVSIHTDVLQQACKLCTGIG